MKTKTLVKRIAKFHNNYEREFLKERVRNKTHLLNSPKDALFYILDYSFYQGRRDEISAKFKQRAKATLASIFENNDILLSGSSRITSKEKLKIKYKKLDKLLTEVLHFLSP
jgi:hypothetical protein